MENEFISQRRVNICGNIFFIKFLKFQINDSIILCLTKRINLGKCKFAKISINLFSNFLIIIFKVNVRNNLEKDAHKDETLDIRDFFRALYEFNENEDEFIRYK
jgi:hypothetical protein